MGHLCVRSLASNGLVPYRAVPPAHDDRARPQHLSDWAHLMPDVGRYSAGEYGPLEPSRVAASIWKRSGKNIRRTTRVSSSAVYYFGAEQAKGVPHREGLRSKPHHPAGQSERAIAYSNCR